MKAGLQLLADRLPELKRALKGLTRQEVLVGIPAAAEDRKNGEPIANAELGYIHENGAPEAGIPARPFLAPGIEDAQVKISSYLRQAGSAALEGNEGKMERALEAAGITAVASVKKKLETGPFQKLLDATLARRKNRKVAPRTGTKPLIDTAQMQGAVTYVRRVAP